MVYCSYVYLQRRPVISKFLETPYFSTHVTENTWKQKVRQIFNFNKYFLITYHVWCSTLAMIFSIIIL